MNTEVAKIDILRDKYFNDPRILRKAGYVTSFFQIWIGRWSLYVDEISSGLFKLTYFEGSSGIASPLESKPNNEIEEAIEKWIETAIKKEPTK